MDVVVNVYFIDPMTNDLTVSSWCTCDEDSYWTLSDFKKQYGEMVSGEIVSVSFIKGKNINYIF